MKINVYHLREGVENDDRWRLTTGTPDQDEIAARLWASGRYEHVATIVGDGLEDAYRLTQNGIESDSWSREPPRDLTPVEPSFHLAQDGRKLGRRSSMVGDVFEFEGGRRFVCATFGFVELPA